MPHFNTGSYSLSSTSHGLEIVSVGATHSGLYRDSYEAPAVPPKHLPSSNGAGAAAEELAAVPPLLVLAESPLAGEATGAQTCPTAALAPPETLPTLVLEAAWPAGAAEHAMTLPSEATIAARSGAGGHSEGNGAAAAAAARGEAPTGGPGTRAEAMWLRHLTGLRAAAGGLDEDLMRLEGLKARIFLLAGTWVAFPSFSRARKRTLHRCTGC